MLNMPWPDPTFESKLSIYASGAQHYWQIDCKVPHDAVTIRFMRHRTGPISDELLTTWKNGGGGIPSGSVRHVVSNNFGDVELQLFIKNGDATKITSEEIYAEVAPSDGPAWTSKHWKITWKQSRITDAQQLG